MAKNKFRTAFISKPGGRENNQDFCAYIEQDGLGCWVMADGLGGHAGGEIASQTVVEEIISAFMSKPELSGKAVEEYIYIAQQEIVRLQDNNKDFSQMSTTVVVLLTDYKKAVWGHIGDSRLYYLKEGRIQFVTKDHSIPQLLVDTGQIDEKDIRNHEERNRLTKAIGKRGEVIPKITELNAELERNDAFILCTDGFWEYVNELEMEEELENSHDPEEWLIKMEKKILNKVLGNNDNYSAFALMVEANNKVAEKEEPVIKKKKGSKLKKVAIFVLGLSLLTSGSLFLYNKIKTNKKSKQQNEVKLKEIEEKQEEIDNAKEVLKEANKLLENEKYEESIDKFKEAKNIYNNLEIDKYNQDISENITKANDLKEAKNLEKLAAKAGLKKEFDNSIEKYKNAVEIYKSHNMSANALKLTGLIKGIEAAKGQKVKTKSLKVLGAEKLIKMADKDLLSNNKSAAIGKLSKAKKVFSTLGMQDMVDEIDEKINNLATQVENPGLKTAISLEQKGDDELSASNFDEAKKNYFAAKQLYINLKEEDKISLLDYKIKDVEAGLEKIQFEDSKKIIEAEKLEKNAKESLALDQYVKALKSFESAQLLFVGLKLTDRAKMLDLQIVEIKEKIKEIDMKNLEESLKLADKSMETGEFSVALANYKAAKSLYQNLNQPQKTLELDLKVKAAELSISKDKLETKKLLEEADKIEKNADLSFDKLEYKKSINEYKDSLEIYSKFNIDAVGRVKGKIQKAKEEVGSKLEDMVFVEGGSNMKVVEYDFYIGKYEITSTEYLEYCEALNLNKPVGRANKKPVVNVTWWDAIRYCNWRSEKENFAKAYDEISGELLDENGQKTTDISQVSGYRLPTDAEWEYAARGGNYSRSYRYSGGKNLEKVAWYKENSKKEIHFVGNKRPNELGIFDMSGNVWELCYDPWLNKEDSLNKRVMRGGAWDTKEKEVYIIEARDKIDWKKLDSNTGFRLVLNF